MSNCLTYMVGRPIGYVSQFQLHRFTLSYNQTVKNTFCPSLLFAIHTEMIKNEKFIFSKLPNQGPIPCNIRNYEKFKMTNFYQENIIFNVQAKHRLCFINSGIIHRIQAQDISTLLVQAQLYIIFDGIFITVVLQD